MSDPAPNSDDASQEVPEGLHARLQRSVFLLGLRVMERWLPEGFEQMSTEGQRQIRTVLVFAMVVAPASLVLRSTPHRRTKAA